MHVTRTPSAQFVAKSVTPPLAKRCDLRGTSDYRFIVTETVVRMEFIRRAVDNKRPSEGKIGINEEFMLFRVFSATFNPFVRGTLVE